MVTGRHELDVKDLRDKLGSVVGSTKCCVTGTCDNYIGSEVDAPIILLERHTVSIEVIVENVTLTTLVNLL